MFRLVSLTILGLLGLAQALPAVKPRIVGGTNASLGEFPSLVSLQYYNTHICGATLISESFAITAAHCFESFDFESIIFGEFTIRFGDLNIGDGSDYQDLSRSVNVSGIQPHPNFTHIEKEDWLTIRNDILILLLDTPIDFSKSPNVKPVKLPSQNQAAPLNATATLAGWGTVDAYGHLPTILQKLNITVFDYPYCEIQVGGKHNFSEAQNLCGGDLENTVGQCSGDSGGPLYVDDVLWGIVSWSLKPCITAPGVFTNVAFYIDWIHSITGLAL